MSDEPLEASSTARRHLRFGWWSLAVFATVGLTLEVLHGFKIRAYLDVSSETRRLMWTLAHAHGALVGIVNILYGLTLERDARNGTAFASGALVAAGVLLPLGFFLGGLVSYGGDPGLGVVLVPIGAVLLVFALASIARAVPRGPADLGRADRQGRR